MIFVIENWKGLIETNFILTLNDTIEMFMEYGEYSMKEIAIGISDKTRRIEGTDFEVQKLNELLRVPYDFCEPSVPIQIEKVPCIDFQRRENHVVLMHIEPSMAVHTNQADEAFLRVGDKSKKLSFEERTQLMYDKGERYFEDKAVPDATVDDLDMGLVKAYIGHNFS